MKFKFSEMPLDIVAARKVVLSFEKIQIEPEVLEDNLGIIDLMSSGLMEADKLPIPRETEPSFMRNAKTRKD